MDTIHAYLSSKCVYACFSTFVHGAYNVHRLFCSVQEQIVATEY